jgi:site-specific recombinase XerD
VLTLADVDLKRRTIAVRNGKGDKARLAPIWDAGTYADLQDWLARRRAEGATDADYVLVTSRNTPLNRSDASQTFGKICKVLNRPVTPSIHDGRHTFLSNALHAGKTLPSVQRAAGHTSIATTSHYLHEIGTNDELIDLFKV